MAKANKLTVFLLKDEIPEDGIVKKGYRSKAISVAGGEFYHDSSAVKPPSWISSFFSTKLNEVKSLYVASAKAAFIYSLEIDGNKKRFALCFGTGRHILESEVIEERFGLKVTLNSIKPESIRGIEKTSMGAHSKNSREQMSRASKASDFGIDIEQDLLKTMTGESSIPLFEKLITGVDAFNVSSPVAIDEIDGFLRLCHRQFLSTEYLKHFDWVDQISEIKNKTLINSLNETLVESINRRDFSNTWMAIPEIIDWSDVAGFRYLPRQKELLDDLYIDRFIHSIDGEIDDITPLKRRFIKVFSASQDTEIFSWSAFKCIYTEITIDEKCFVLNNGKWYEIEKSFVGLVNKSYDDIPLSSIELPDYNHENEGDYNEKATESAEHYLLMDKNNISHGGGTNKIEFCDIYTKSKQLIHIKHYGASSVLSHLFLQGLNSAEYFHSDSDFRKKLNAKLKTGWKLSNPNSRIDGSEYEVIYAIISNDDAERPRIPFFSKVSIKNVKRKLETMNFKVSLKRIKSLKS
jgi:uncharacterized protein (TIGR04141 family)